VTWSLKAGAGPNAIGVQDAEPVRAPWLDAWRQVIGPTEMWRRVAHTADDHSMTTDRWRRIDARNHE
jgi:hypothetical protein